MRMKKFFLSPFIFLLANCHFVYAYNDSHVAVIRAPEAYARPGAYRPLPQPTFPVRFPRPNIWSNRPGFTREIDFFPSMDPQVNRYSISAQAIKNHPDRIRIALGIEFERHVSVTEQNVEDVQNRFKQLGRFGTGNFKFGSTNLSTGGISLRFIYTMNVPAEKRDDEEFWEQMGFDVQEFFYLMHPNQDSTSARLWVERIVPEKYRRLLRPIILKILKNRTVRPAPALAGVLPDPPSLQPHGDSGPAEPPAKRRRFD
jgi:hypothetical protein